MQNWFFNIKQTYEYYLKLCDLIFQGDSKSLFNMNRNLICLKFKKCKSWVEWAIENSGFKHERKRNGAEVEGTKLDSIRIKCQNSKSKKQPCSYASKIQAFACKLTFTSLSLELNETPHINKVTFKKTLSLSLPHLFPIHEEKWTVNSLSMKVDRWNPKPLLTIPFFFYSPNITQGVTTKLLFSVLRVGGSIFCP